MNLSSKTLLCISLLYYSSSKHTTFFVNLQRCSSPHSTTLALTSPLEQNGGHLPGKGSLYSSAASSLYLNLKQPQGPTWVQDYCWGLLLYPSVTKRVAQTQFTLLASALPLV